MSPFDFDTLLQSGPSLQIAPPPAVPGTGVTGSSNAPSAPGSVTDLWPVALVFLLAAIAAGIFLSRKKK